MSIKHDNNRTLKDLYVQIENNEVVLPNFQRGYVWDVSKQRSFIASFLVEIPIGSTLHLKGENGDFSARSLCEFPSVEPKEICEYVLDGQQRLSTLKNTFYNLYDASPNWLETYKILYNAISNRWFLKIDNQYFGYEKLKFEDEKMEKAEPWQIMDYIENKKITDKKKDLNSWFHPAFNPLDEHDKPLSGSHRKILIKNESCVEQIIPLYELSLGKKGIHREVLKCIALKRTEELRADIKDKLITLENIMIDIVTDMETLKNEPEEITRAWATLEATWVSDVSSYLEKLMDTKMPIILLPSEEIGRAAAIFEEINKGGQVLSTYDLIVAKSAKLLTQKKTLTQIIIDKLSEKCELGYLSQKTNWKAICMSDAKDKEKELSSKFHEVFLGSLSLIINCKVNGQPITKDITNKGVILKLNAQDISDYFARILKAIIRAYAFLQFRCGIINEKNIRYVYMILPLVYLLDEDKIWEDEKKLDILEAWYWSVFFSGEYKSKQDEKLVNNINLLVSLLTEDEVPEEWIENDDLTFGKKDTILKKLGYSDIETLSHYDGKTVAPKAMVDAILQFELSQNPQDFLPSSKNNLSSYKAACFTDDIDSEENCKTNKLEIHHIIPLAEATKIGEKSAVLRENKAHILNSPLNLTYISECANRTLGRMEMNKYTKELGESILDHLLTTEEDFFDKKHSEAIEEYYSRCINRRFALLQDKLKGKIRDLLR